MQPRPRPAPRRAGQARACGIRFSRIEDVVLPNTKRLLDFCRATRNREGLREHEINDLVKPGGNERVFNKLGASGFSSTALELVLRVYEVDTLLFAGVSTDEVIEKLAAATPATAAPLNA